MKSLAVDFLDRERLREAARNRRRAEARPLHDVRLSSTTSTQDSGLFGHILPIFTAKTGIEVNVVAEGTGQALDTARRGNADVVFVHAKSDEQNFVLDGWGVKRHPVMYNDFVLIGPRSDPAAINGTADVVAALKAIKKKGAPFISRGDRSGTHIAEVNLWKAADVNIDQAGGPWYKSIGQGMGATLNAALASGFYTLADRGTWLSLKDRGDLVIAVQGDKRLFNQYGVMLVNPAKHPNVRMKPGRALIDWLISFEGQKAIADHKIGGEQLFFPNTNDPST